MIQIEMVTMHYTSVSVAVIWPLCSYRDGAVSTESLNNWSLNSVTFCYTSEYSKFAAT